MTRRACCLVLAGMMVLGAPAASAQRVPLGIPGTYSASAFSREAGRRLVFICPAIGKPSDNVWGVDVYSADSAICSAAIHAGVLAFQQTGLVAIVMGGTASSFEGTSRNGVTSTSYPIGGYSFTFDRNTGPAAIDWLTSMQDVPADFNQSVTVICPTGGNADGVVWGTDTYTNDSPICLAAVHAGVINFDGGAVSVTKVAGLDSYAATLQHDIQSRSWSAWADAFTVSAGTAEAVAGGMSSGRIIRLAGYTGTGNGPDIVPRTIELGGFAGTGTGPDIVPRTIRVGGWTGTGTAP